MKKLFKFFLPVCILLCSGYIRLSGHTLAEPARDSTPDKSEKAPVNFFTLNEAYQEFTIKPVLSDIERENALNHAAKVEEKEDELQSFKKHLDFTSDYSIACLFQTTAYSRVYARRFQYSAKCLSFRPSDGPLFLKLGVLRI